MATAVVLKSESADLYLFALDDCDLEDVTDFCTYLKDQWYVGEEYLYLEQVYSEKFDVRDVTKGVVSLLESEAPK